MSSDDVIEEWFICFCDVKRKHWIQRVLKPGFHHVKAFKHSPGGQFMVLVDSMRSHLDIDIVPLNEENIAKYTEGCKVVTVVVKYDLLFDRGHFCRFNCVEVVKSLLGIRSFWTFTPYQLYKRLTR